MRTVQYGGTLQIGDFVAISYAYGFEFGWYCGEGQNTLQFFEYTTPSTSLNYYDNVKLDSAYLDHPKANSEEFNKKWMRKSYVTNWRDRVMKIEYPESIFTEQQELDLYIESKQILEQIKFI
jgi:hypothetical protein